MRIGSCENSFVNSGRVTSINAERGNLGTDKSVPYKNHCKHGKMKRILKSTPDRIREIRVNPLNPCEALESLKSAKIRQIRVNPRSINILWTEF
ncbi:MAG: hypothetical protein FWG87_14960 [Defluviitaleaceae bacterium]|nr:hypothetical protein [Defluviitaleaceae bacterium]